MVLLQMIFSTLISSPVFLQMFSELNPNVEQIPVGYEVSGIVTKGQLILIT